MNSGRVVGIFIAPTGAAPMQAVEKVKAHSNRGLEGDRYFLGTGTFFKKTSSRPEPLEQLTLIESEAIEALCRDDEVNIDPIQARRNILTEGVALNHLVGREFTVGPVRVKGVKLCEPCGHLESLTTKGVRAGLVHRGGLRAQILSDGLISVGDQIAS